MPPPLSTECVVYSQARKVILEEGLGVKVLIRYDPKLQELANTEVRGPSAAPHKGEGLTEVGKYPCLW